MEGPKTGSESRHSEMEMDATQEPRKTARHRKKLIINKLRVQMEFYFSAANLSKDKFMIGLLENDPYIDLELFFKFNRIRTLTDDISLLKKAVVKSRILELSEDELRVKRSIPYQVKPDVALCTIYVENIPSHVDHEWIYEVFSKYGTIDYISFPRFKSTGRPKGFAFIEFENTKMANVALERFGAIGCKIPPDTEPGNLQSIRTHEATESESGKLASSGMCFSEQREFNVEKMENVDSSDQSEPKVNMIQKKDDEETLTDKEIDVKRETGKRKVEELDDDDDENSVENAEARRKQKCDGVKLDEISKLDKSICDSEKELSKDVKKRKIEELEEIIRDVRKDIDKEKAGETQNKKETGETHPLQKSLEEEGGTELIRKSKKRKLMPDNTDLPSDTSAVKGEAPPVGETPVAKSKNKKKKKRKRNKKEKGDSLEGISLKVMSKPEWSRLRNQYLNMQKKNMESLKSGLQKRSFNAMQSSCPPPSKTPSKGQPQFIADAIIKISFEEPPHDPKKLQETIREGSRGGVAYVETSAAEKDVYVRFVSSDAASTYLKAGLWSRMILLSGEDEKDYWKHCIDSWVTRRSKKSKQMKGTCSDISNGFRGREKLLQKAVREAQNVKPNTHKVFD